MTRNNSVGGVTAGRLRGFLVLCLVLAVLCGPASPARAADPVFGAPIVTSVPFGAYEVAIGDFNGDGNGDLVVGETFTSGGNRFCLMLGNGDGTFGVPTTYAGGIHGPMAFRADDLNGDGKLDLAVMNHGLTVSIFLGNGDGTIVPLATYPIRGTYLHHMTSGDFNGDGSIDLAVAAYGFPGLVTILLNNGDGTYWERTTIEISYYPNYIIAADFNRDAKLDLATSEEGVIGILLGNGDGTFRRSAFYAPSPVTVASGDVDEDGFLDLAITLWKGTGAYIARGRGDGTFGAWEQQLIERGWGTVLMADFTNDGHTDIAAALHGGTNKVALIPGTGAAGGVSVPSYYTTGGETYRMAHGDLDGNGSLDLVLSDGWTGSRVFVLLNQTVPPDGSAPVTTAAAVPAPNADDWYSSPVTVTLSAIDEAGGSGVKEIRYLLNGLPEHIEPGAVAAVSIVAEGANLLVFSARDNVGNAEAPQSRTFRVDTTPPTVEYAGNAGTYAVNDIIRITCSSDDNLSGILSTTCRDIVGPAYTFDLGTTVAVAEAVDRAGNTARATAEFSVRVTYDGVLALVRQLVAQAGLANALVVKLESARRSEVRGNAAAKAGSLAAFVNLLEAQSGKAVTPDQAALLVALARAL